MKKLVYIIALSLIMSGCAAPEVSESQGEENRLGSQQAPIEFVLYSNYDCALCSYSYENIKQIHEKYPTQVSIEYRQFPIENVNSQSRYGARAGICAAEQNKFWEFSDYIFDNFDQLSESFFDKAVLHAGLDKTKFEKCLEDDATKGRINQDLLAAYDSGVTKIPTFVINGIAVPAEADFSEYDKIVQFELNEQK